MAIQYTPFFSEEERLMQAIMDPDGAVSQLGPQSISPQMADAMQQQAVTNAATALPQPPVGVLGGGAANGLLDDPSVYGGPLTPSGQAGPQWQQNLQQFLGSPGWAMASQAMLNSDAAQRNQTVGTSPAMAFRQVQMQNQALQMKRASMLDERERRAEALRRWGIANERAAEKAALAAGKDERDANPFYELEEGKRRGYFPPDMTPAQWMALGNKPATPNTYEMKKDDIARFHGFPNAAAAEAAGHSGYLTETRDLATGSGINIDVSTGEGASWETQDIEDSIADYRSLMTGARQADDRINRLTAMRNLNPQIESGGTLGSLVDGIKQNLEGIGIDLPGINEDTTPRQLYEALATQSQFERTALLKGAISEKELDLAGRMDGNMANTQEGRQAILEYRLLEQNRIRDLGDAAEAYRRRIEAEGGNYRERDFRRSEEYQILKRQPFMSRGLFESLRDSVETDKGKSKFGDYMMVGGTWWMKNPDDPDGDAIPVRFYGE